MKRTLLPYEHQLVEELGVTEQEYLDFLMATRDYTQSYEQIMEKPQCDPATLATVSLVLTIVGTLFQVAAALLAPRPEEEQRNGRKARERRFSPRFGFNSTQDLAQYGEPINLIYCNTSQNPRGAVRAATSLVWSSVEGNGSSQFMQLLLLVGAAKVKSIDFSRTAFGQLPLGQFSGSSTWLYYNENGRVRYSNKVLGDGADPSRDGAPDSSDVCEVRNGNVRLEGFSQAFSPSSLTSIGIYDPIPINADVQERKQSGSTEWAAIGIRLKGGNWGSTQGVNYRIGDRITLVFNQTRRRKDEVSEEAANAIRYQTVSSLDRASTYLFGTAEFRLVAVSDNTNLDDNAVEAVLECTVEGRRPSTSYDDTRAATDRDNEERDDNFYTKALVKADYAAYQTVTAADYVRFSMRCRLFRRIQGRQRKYGEEDAPDGYRLSDNGIQARMAFMKVSYMATGDSGYTEVPVIFAVRRGADQDSFIDLGFNSAQGPRKWQFRIRPIADIGAEVASNGQVLFGFIENAGRTASYTMTDGSNNVWRWTGKLVNTGGNIKNALPDRGPAYTNEWDLFSTKSDTNVQFSFENGPEFAITAVTEQQVGALAGKYDSMSMMALGVYSGKGVQDLRSITNWVTEGRESWLVNENTGAAYQDGRSTSYAPDIFADTVLDKENGIGKYARSEGVAWDSLALAKRFCKNNGLGCQLFMDGMIADLSAWRAFWTEVAPYSLLEFAKVGGREGLIPAIPTLADGTATRQVPISAMFTAGNILEGSYKEEFIDYGDSTQDLIATVIYRDTELRDVFPRNTSVQISLLGVNEATAIRQTFDLSQFVTQRQQAILFGKLLCNQRRWMRRGVEFRTFPQMAPISPGAYVFVDVGFNTWDGITSGMIMAGGVLNSPLVPSIANGSYNVLTYKSGRPVQTFTSVSVVNGTAASLAAQEGCMFVLGVATTSKRVFRITDVSMDEEGEVTVKAIEHPCEASGSALLSRVANFDDALFRVV
jgi:hypothetical protein